MTTASTSYSARRTAALLSLGRRLPDALWQVDGVRHHGLVCHPLGCARVGRPRRRHGLRLRQHRHGGASRADLKYPYGYGKIGFFSAGFEGGLISLAGLAILYEATVALIRGSQPSGSTSAWS